MCIEITIYIRYIMSKYNVIEQHKETNIIK
jgi:hypothetical protein